MKNIYLLFLIAIATVSAQAQTTATNFTENDCNGNSFTLFSDLDAGKVVVMVWVMPCGTCTGPAKTAFNVAKSFASSHPDKVIYYLIDDYANSSCNSVANWGSSNNITPNAVFSSSGISMSNYGSDGMPKVVVLGGKNHKIYFNKNNAAAGNSTEIQTAINQALSDITSVQELRADKNVNIFPNPVHDILNISFTQEVASEVNIELFSITGSKVMGIAYPKQPAGLLHYELNVSNLPKGVYYLRVNGTFQKLSVQ